MASSSSSVGFQDHNYSSLPDSLRNVLYEMSSMTSFEGIQDSEVAFFLDETHFRLKLMSVIGWSPTLTTVDLRSLGMTSQDAHQLCEGLSESKSIETLRAGFQRSLGDSGAEEFATLLRKTTSLKTLELPHCNIGYRGAMALGEALKSNKSLVKLDLSSNCMWRTGDQGRTGIEQLVLHLAASVHRLPDNTTLQTLLIGGASNKLCKKGAKAVNCMLRTNHNLRELAVHLNPLSDHRVYTLVSPLTRARSIDRQHNTALQKLSVGFARKAEGGNGAQEMRWMLEHNHTLLELTLINIEHSWEQGDLEGLLKALQQNKSPSLRFLRFYGFQEAPEVLASLKARDNTFLKSWKDNGKDSLMNTSPSPAMPSPTDLRKNSELVAAKRTSDTKLFARIILCGHRDSGINEFFGMFSEDNLPSRKSASSSAKKSIHVLEDNDDITVSLWNFSGNKTIYNSFQSELLLPNRARSEGSPTSFIVCVKFDARTDSEIKEDISYWFRFLASSITTPTILAPTVWILLSGSGHLEPSIIETLARKYEEVLTVEKGALFVSDVPTAQKVREHIVNKLKNYKQELPAIPRACLKPAQSRIGGTYMQSFHEWQEIYKSSEKEMSLEELSHHLHDVGENIFFSNFEYKKIVVINPDYLISEVIPQLLDLLRPHASEGFVEETTVERVFKNNDVVDGLILMRCLKLCDKSDHDKIDHLSFSDKLFIPELLLESSDLSWKTNGPGIYVGRRFVSRDKVRTFITHSFFHELQLKLSRNGGLWNHGAALGTSVELEQNLIRITTKTMEIVVQFGSLSGPFIDVLAQSNDSYTNTVSFIHKYVRNHIQKLSKSTKGLDEGLIRPACVQKLLPCKYRQTQVVMMKHLISELRMSSCPLNHEHLWPSVEDQNKTWKLEEGSDLVIGWLDAEDCEDILKRKKVSAVRPETLSNFLTSGPCPVRAQSTNIANLHNLFVKHMIQNNTEVQGMLFEGAMPSFR